MQTPKRIAVVGASGRLGTHLVAVFNERGVNVVPISRTHGIDVITRDGLDDALRGVDLIIDSATGPSPDEQSATEFFTTSVRNLQDAGHRAGVRGMITLSIVGTDKFTSGYGAAKIAQEQAALRGPIPARILRATQFHEFIGLLVEWSTQGEVAYVPDVVMQPIAARAVAEVAADIARSGGATNEMVEVAGPRPEQFVDMANLLVAHNDLDLKIEGVDDNPIYPLRDRAGLLPGPNAILAGPTFEDWLRTQ